MHDVAATRVMDGGLSERRLVSFSTSAPSGDRAACRDAAVVVFCRAAAADARRWGWSGDGAMASDPGVLGRRALLRQTLAAAVRGAGQDADVLVFQHGDEPEPSEECLRSGVKSWQQQRGTTFGRRLEDTVARVLARGYRRVVVVGSDVPSLSPADLRSALSKLNCAAVVIGKDSTGGCYLIGLCGSSAKVLDGVPWGTGRDARCLRETAERAGGGVSVLDRVLQDVDTVADVSRVRELGSSGLETALTVLVRGVFGDIVAQRPGVGEGFGAEWVLEAFFAWVRGLRPTGPPA